MKQKRRENAIWKRNKETQTQQDMNKWSDLLVLFMFFFFVVSFPSTATTFVFCFFFFFYLFKNVQIFNLWPADQTRNSVENRIAVEQGACHIAPSYCSLKLKKTNKQKKKKKSSKSTTHHQNLLWFRFSLS